MTRSEDLGLYGRLQLRWRCDGSPDDLRIIVPTMVAGLFPCTTFTGLFGTTQTVGRCPSRGGITCALDVGGCGATGRAVGVTAGVVAATVGFGAVTTGAAAGVIVATVGFGAVTTGAAAGVVVATVGFGAVTTGAAAGVVVATVGLDATGAPEVTGVAGFVAARVGWPPVLPVGTASVAGVTAGVVPAVVAVGFGPTVSASDVSPSFCSALG